MRIRRRLFLTYLIFILLFLSYFASHLVITAKLNRVEGLLQQMQALREEWAGMLVSMNEIVVNWDDGRTYRSFLSRSEQLGAKLSRTVAAGNLALIRPPALGTKIIALQEMWAIAQMSIADIGQKVERPEFQRAIVRISRGLGLQNLNAYWAELNAAAGSRAEAVALRQVIQAIEFFPVYSETFSRQFALIQEDIAVAKHNNRSLHLAVLAVIVILVFAVLILLSLRFTKRISRPITRSTRRLIDFIGGSIDGAEMPHADELAQLEASVDLLVNYYSGLSRSMETIARGDISLPFRKYSQHDVIGDSLVALYRYLKDVERASDHLRQGDYHFPIEPKSDKDRLTTTFKYMRDAIAREIDLMNSIVESVDEAICVIRPDFQIVKANQNLHRLLRRKPADTERIVEVLRGLNGKEGIIQRAFGGAEVTDCRRMIPLGRRRIPVKVTTRVLRLEEPECRNVMVCLKNESSDYRNRVQRKKLRLQATIAELKALRAQINPHFLFNSLNTIAQLVDIDKERAVDTLSLLADLFRYVMVSTKKERVRVEEELQYIGKYLEMLTLRFGESLEVRYEVDESILDREIPPMLIQPLVENAIKYGGDAQGRIAVGITIVPEDGHLRFRVADNGHSLLDVSAVLETSSTGIQNINNRLMTLYNQQLEFARNAPQGLAVGFRIPLGG